MNVMQREKSTQELIDNLESIMKITYPLAAAGDQLHAKINSLTHGSLKLIKLLEADGD
jgi:hypothetical protein